MRFVKTAIDVMVVVLVAVVVACCQSGERQSAQKSSPEPQPGPHNGLTASPMSSDSLLWSTTQYMMDESGEEWLQGIAIDPSAAIMGCPCCPIRMDSGGCCWPCAVYTYTRYEDASSSKELSEAPAVLLTMSNQFPGPGTVVARVACLISREPKSVDSLETQFDLEVTGTGAMKLETTPSRVSRRIPPAAALGNKGQWVQFSRQFHVGTSRASFSLNGNVPAGGQARAQARLVTLTFIPE